MAEKADRERSWKACSASTKPIAYRIYPSYIYNLSTGRDESYCYLGRDSAKSNNGNNFFTILAIMDRKLMIFLTHSKWWEYSTAMECIKKIINLPLRHCASFRQPLYSPSNLEETLTITLSLSGNVQQSGHAGRDGPQSSVKCFVGRGFIKEISNADSKEKMIALVKSWGCRRRMLCLFGEIEIGSYLTNSLPYDNCQEAVD